MLHQKLPSFFLTHITKFDLRMNDFFHTEEIRNSRLLKWIYGALILGYFMALQSAVFQPLGLASKRVNANYVCPELFPNCSHFFMFETMPFGYSYQAFIAFISCFLVGSIMLAAFERWGLALAALTPLFIVKTWMAFFQSAEVSIPFETYLIVPSFLFLFSRKKLANLRLIFVVLYVLAGVVKFHEGWIAGTYFSTLKIGLPFFNRDLIPIFTNLVIFMELLGAWLLLSQNWKWKIAPFAFFLCFHFYSILFVGFRYPALTLPYLLILFSTGSETHKSPSLAGLIAALLITVLNLIPFTIPGDHKLTYEGMALAMNMFDANRQSISSETHIMADRSKKEIISASSNSFERNPPYRIFQRIQHQCKNKEISAVKWTLDTSINGSPFYRIVDTENACELTYQPYRHNEWIRLDPEIIGYADYNHYYGIPQSSASPKGTRVLHEPVIAHPKLAIWFIQHSSIFIWIHALLALIFPVGLFFDSFRDKFKIQF